MPNNNNSVILNKFIKRTRVFALPGLIALLVLSTGGATLSNSAHAADARPIIIAEVCPTTGRFALHCEGDRRGVVMAIDEFNAHGGVLGRRIILVSRNPTLDTHHAAKVARQLITVNHIGFMVGAIDSGVAASMSAVCQKYGVIFINTNSSSPSESVEHAHRTKFVFDANAANFNRALFKYALSRRKSKRVVLLTEDDVWGRSSAAASRPIIAQYGGKVVGEVIVPASLPDPVAAIKRVEAIPADVVGVNISGNNQIRLFSQIDPAILKRQSWVVGEVDWEELYPAPGTPRPLYGITWAWNLNTPGTAAFTARYRKLYGNTRLDYPGDVTYSAYFATKALLNAIKKAGTTDNHAVIKQLEHLRWSAHERMSDYPAYMDPLSHHLQQAICIATWHPRTTHPELGQQILACIPPNQVFYKKERTTRLEPLSDTPLYAP